MSGEERGPASETSLLDSAVHWMGVGAHSIFWSTVSFMWGLVERTGPRQHALMNIWARMCLQSAGVRVTVRGAENILRDRPQIFFSSHASIADICVLGAVLPVEYRWLARKEVFHVPFIGWYLSLARHLRIDRGNRESAIRLLREAADRVRSGTNLLVFPEGTRSPDGDLLPVKNDMFHLASAAGVPILPIRLLGAGRIVPKGNMRLGPADVLVLGGEPLPPQGPADAVPPALMKRLPGARTALGIANAQP